MREQCGRLEAANREMAARIKTIQENHARQLIEFAAKSQVSEVQLAEKFQPLLDAIDVSELPDELRTRIGNLGDDPFRDLADLKQILKDIIKHMRKEDKECPQAMYLFLQLSVNETAGAIELSTKIVEHGTSGIKTLLQTQT